MRDAVVLGLVVCALAISGRASASPSAKLVYLRGSGTETCPPEADLRKAVAVRLGYDPFFPTAQKTVVAEVDRAKDGYRGRVRIVADDGAVRGERELATKGDDCSELTTALALAVSIALDDLDEPSVSAPPAPATEPATAPITPEPEEEPRPTPPPSAPAKPPVTAAAEPELTLALGPTIAIGTAPAAAPGASFAGIVRWPQIAIRIDAHAELPASTSIGSAGGELSTNVALGTASVCYRVGFPFACAGGGAGAIWSRTTRITRPAEDRALLLAAVLKIGVDVPLGKRFFIEPFLDLGANLVPHRVDVDGVTRHEFSPVWGVLGIYAGGKIL